VHSFNPEIHLRYEVAVQRIHYILFGQWHSGPPCGASTTVRIANLISPQRAGGDLHCFANKGVVRVGGPAPFCGRLLISDLAAPCVSALLNKNSKR
jgi:hypothetical protein